MAKKVNTAVAQRVKAEFETAKARVQPTMSGMLLWEIFSAEERRRLGGDMTKAYRKHGTIGMWRTLRGGSRERAVLDIARELDFLTDSKHRWLRREMGQAHDFVDEEIQAAIDVGDLVIVDHPQKALYWKGQEVRIAWNKHPAQWRYVWELVLASKGGGTIDRSTFGFEDQKYCTKQLSRLTRETDFPDSLADLVLDESGTQRLHVPSSAIRVFQVEQIEVLREASYAAR